VTRFIELRGSYIEAFITLNGAENDTPLREVYRGIFEEVIEKNLREVSCGGYLSWLNECLTSLNSNPLLSYKVL